MSRQATMSILGLYQWNNGLFDLMVVPEGVDKDTFTDNLIAETCELEVLYPSYEVMKNLIGVWSHKMLPVWEHLYETTQYEYDPIENYNRTEVETINGEGSRVHSGTDRTTTGGTDTTTHGGQNSRTQTTTNTGDNRHSIAGFDSVPTANSDGLVLNDTDDAHSTEIINGSDTFGKTETLQHGRTEQMVHGEQIDDTTESTRENHTSGNIGVTTTQKMIREEREIAEFNIYDRMIKDFMDRFCIMVF